MNFLSQLIDQSLSRLEFKYLQDKFDMVQLKEETQEQLCQRFLQSLDFTQFDESNCVYFTKKLLSVYSQPDGFLQQCNQKFSHLIDRDTSNEINLSYFPNTKIPRKYNWLTILSNDTQQCIKMLEDVSNIYLKERFPIKIPELTDLFINIPKKYKTVVFFIYIFSQQQPQRYVCFNSINTNVHNYFRPMKLILQDFQNPEVKALQYIEKLLHTMWQPHLLAKAYSSIQLDIRLINELCDNIQEPKTSVLIEISKDFQAIDTPFILIDQITTLSSNKILLISVFKQQFTDIYFPLCYSEFLPIAQQISKYFTPIDNIYVESIVVKNQVLIQFKQLIRYITGIQTLDFDIMSVINVLYSLVIVVGDNLNQFDLLLFELRNDQIFLSYLQVLKPDYNLQHNDWLVLIEDFHQYEIALQQDYSQYIKLFELFSIREKFENILVYTSFQHLNEVNQQFAEFVSFLFKYSHFFYQKFSECVVLPLPYFVFEQLYKACQQKLTVLIQTDTFIQLLKNNVFLFHQEFLVFITGKKSFELVPDKLQCLLTLYDYSQADDKLADIKYLPELLNLINSTATLVRYIRKLKASSVKIIWEQIFGEFASITTKINSSDFQSFLTTTGNFLKLLDFKQQKQDSNANFFLFKDLDQECRSQEMQYVISQLQEMLTICSPITFIELNQMQNFMIGRLKQFKTKELIYFLQHTKIFCMHTKFVSDISQTKDLSVGTNKFIALHYFKQFNHEQLLVLAKFVKLFNNSNIFSSYLQKLQPLDNRMNLSLLQVDYDAIQQFLQNYITKSINKTLLSAFELQNTSISNAIFGYNFNVDKSLFSMLPISIIIYNETHELMIQTPINSNELKELMKIVDTFITLSKEIGSNSAMNALIKTNDFQLMSFSMKWDYLQYQHSKEYYQDIQKQVCHFKPIVDQPVVLFLLKGLFIQINISPIIALDDLQVQCINLALHLFNEQHERKQIITPVCSQNLSFLIDFFNQNILPMLTFGMSAFDNEEKDILSFSQKINILSLLVQNSRKYSLFHQLNDEFLLSQSIQLNFTNKNFADDIDNVYLKLFKDKDIKYLQNVFQISDLNNYNEIVQQVLQFYYELVEQIDNNITIEHQYNKIEQILEKLRNDKAAMAFVKNDVKCCINLIFWDSLNSPLIYQKYCQKQIESDVNTIFKSYLRCVLSLKQNSHVSCFLSSQFQQTIEIYSLSPENISFSQLPSFSFSGNLNSNQITFSHSKLRLTDQIEISDSNEDKYKIEHIRQKVNQQKIYESQLFQKQQVKQNSFIEFKINALPSVIEKDNYMKQLSDFFIQCPNPKTLFNNLRKVDNIQVGIYKRFQKECMVQILSNEQFQDQIFAILSVQRSDESILQLIDIISSLDEKWIVLEYYTNHPHDSFQKDQVQKIAKQTLIQLQSLHDKFQIFGPLSRKSVIITKDFNTSLIDFVNSKQLTEETPNAITAYQKRLAPEVLQTEEYGLPADIWTFGIFILELFSGKQIHETQCHFGAAYKTLFQDILDDFDIENTGQKEFLQHCFQKDPTKRASVKQLLESDFIKNSIIIK